MSIFDLRFFRGASSATADISSEHRELARETIIQDPYEIGHELTNTRLPELVNEKAFELPNGLPGGMGGMPDRGIPGLPDGLGGRFGSGGAGLPGDLGDIFGNGGPGGRGDIFGNGSGMGGPGGLFGHGGFGLPGDPSGIFGNGGPGGPGDLGGIFGNGGPGDLGGIFGQGGFGGGAPGGGFGRGGVAMPGDAGGFGGLGGLGVGLPGDLGGGMPHIKMKGEDAMWHESSDGKRVVADSGETLHLERGAKSGDVTSFEKKPGDSFTSDKEPGTYHHVEADGSITTVREPKTSTDNGDHKTDKHGQPNPYDPNGMPADDGSGGNGPNMRSYAMPADDGTGGGPNWFADGLAAAERLSAAAAPSYATTSVDTMVQFAPAPAESFMSSAITDISAVQMSSTFDMSHMMAASPDLMLR